MADTNLNSGIPEGMLALTDASFETKLQLLRRLEQDGDWFWVGWLLSEAAAQESVEFVREDYSDVEFAVVEIPYAIRERLRLNGIKMPLGLGYNVFFRGGDLGTFLDQRSCAT